MEGLDDLDDQAHEGGVVRERLDLLVRDGRAAPLELPTNFPLGMFPDERYRSGEVPLLPGDRLVIETPGGGGWGKSTEEQDGWNERS